LYEECRRLRRWLLWKDAEIREWKAKNEVLAGLARELLRVAEQPVEIDRAEELLKERERLREQIAQSAEEAA
jgi:hypothetical protein